MEVIGWMEKHAIRWADAGHIPAYLPVATSAEYKAMEPNASRDMGHVARDVAAGPEGQGQGEAGQALADEEVEVVQRCRAHADQDVARADRRVRDVLVPECVEPAVLGEGQRLQEAPSPAFGAFTSTAMFP